MSLPGMQMANQQQMVQTQPFETPVESGPLKFLDETGQPRPVKITRGIEWSPLGTKCEIEGCNEEAYQRCNKDLAKYLYFPYGKFGWKFNGCNRAYCVNHAYFRPKILGKNYFRCRDEECNMKFFRTFKDW